MKRRLLPAFFSRIFMASSLTFRLKNIFFRRFIHFKEKERGKRGHRGWGRERVSSRCPDECAAQCGAWSVNLRLWPELKSWVKHTVNWATHEPQLIKHFLKVGTLYQFLNESNFIWILSLGMELNFIQFLLFFLSSHPEEVLYESFKIYSPKVYWKTMKNKFIKLWYMVDICCFCLHISSIPGITARFSFS